VRSAAAATSVISIRQERIEMTFVVVGCDEYHLKAAYRT
jgi:hypothetical protein